MSLQVVTVLMMSLRKNDVEVIDRHMKVFLLCCHRFCRLHYAAGKVPFWVATSNFPSLLNLPAQIKKYGPIQWYWEGARRRYIQTVKTVPVSMRKTTSHFVRKMEVMQKLITITMAWLKDQIGRRKGARHSRYIVRNYFRCETIEEVEEKFKKDHIILRSQHGSHAKTYHNGLVERSNRKKKGCKTQSLHRKEILSL